MSSSPQASKQGVVREAAARLASVCAAGLRPEDDLALSAWRRESQANEHAFQRALQAWQGARALRDVPGYVDLLGPPTWRERWVALRRRWGRAGSTPAWGRGLALACALVLAVAAVGIRFALNGPDYRTEVAQTREIRLEDGSVVSLGARSALDIEFEPSVRRVRLRGGEAFFSVTPDPARPFVVVAGDTAVRVVGTRFNINLHRAQARVVVEEGVVEVLRAKDAVAGAESRPVVASLRLTAGKQAVIRRDAALPQVAEPLRGAAPGAWRQGRLSYRDATLLEVVADVNRYRDAPIRIVSPELEGRRITTSFRTGQIEQMLDTLPDTLSVSVVRHPDGSIDLEPGSTRR